MRLRSWRGPPWPAGPDHCLLTQPQPSGPCASPEAHSGTPSANVLFHLRGNLPQCPHHSVFPQTPSGRRHHYLCKGTRSLLGASCGEEVIPSHPHCLSLLLPPDQLPSVPLPSVPLLPQCPFPQCPSCLPPQGPDLWLGRKGNGAQGQRPMRPVSGGCSSRPHHQACAMTLTRTQGRHRLGSNCQGREGAAHLRRLCARGCVYTGFLPQAQAPRSWHQTLQGTETAREFPPSPQILPNQGRRRGGAQLRDACAPLCRGSGTGEFALSLGMQGHHRPPRSGSLI